MLKVKLESSLTPNTNTMKQKTLEEKGFKPVAVNDSCFIGTENGKEAVVVMVRYEKQGKRKPIVRFDAKEFPNALYLDKYIEEEKLDVIPDENFRKDKEDVVAVVKALSMASK